MDPTQPTCGTTGGVFLAALGFRREREAYREKKKS